MLYAFLKAVNQIMNTHLKKQCGLSAPGGKAGASIVEVLVALSLFATFITGAVKVIAAQHRVTDQARAHYTAINVAKNRIESLRNMRRSSYTQIANMIEADFTVDEEGLSDLNGKFSRTTRIHTTSVSDLLEIQVTVKIRNPVTLEFGSEQEFVKSYMAKLLDG